MESLYASAAVKLLKVKRMWQVVTGPAAALQATLQRLGWTPVAFDELRDDLGRTHDLTLGSPAALNMAICESVRRWQLRRIEALFPAECFNLNLDVEAIRALLRKQDAAVQWSHVGCGEVL